MVPLKGDEEFTHYKYNEASVLIKNKSNEVFNKIIFLHIIYFSKLNL